MSRRKTPHQKRQHSRERKALDRTILRWAKRCSWSIFDGKLEIHREDQIEIVGLVLARRRL